MKDLIALVIVVSIGIAALGGYGLNIIKFCQSDFEAPYKSEVIRGVGIPFAPIGIIAGWMNIGDES